MGFAKITALEVFAGLSCLNDGVPRKTTCRNLWCFAVRWVLPPHPCMDLGDPVGDHSCFAGWLPRPHGGTQKKAPASGAVCWEGFFRGQSGITLSCGRNISLQKKRSELGRISLNINYSDAFCHTSPKSSEHFTDITSSLIFTVFWGEKLMASITVSIGGRR